MRKEWIHRYIPIIILISLVAISLLIIKDYIVAIIGAFITTYLVYPIHKRLHKKLPSWIAAGITILGTIVIIFLPLVLVIKEVVSQTYRAIQSGVLVNLIEKIESLSLIQRYNLDLSNLTNNLLNFGIKIFSNITLSIASSILSLAIMIFIIYYLLLEWPKISQKARKYVPFENRDKVVKDIADTTKKIVRGTLFLALIETVVACIGFWLAGVEFYLILGVLIGLFAFIPGGPTIVWIPTLLVKLIHGEYISSIIILIFGIFISMYLDLILRTKVAGEEANIHPVIMLLGILGGTPVLGLAGIIVGPLLLSYTIKILEEILGEH